MRSRPGDRRTPTDWLRTKRRMCSVPCVQRKERSTPAVRRCPAGEAINPNRQTSARRMEQSTPARRTGAQREKDQRQTPTAGLDRGRRATSNPPVRSALPAKDQRQLRFSSSTLVGDRGRANHPPVGPVQQGSRTQVSMVGNLGKPNSEVIIAAPGAAKEGLQRPFQRLRQNRSQKLTANPPHLRPGYLHQSPRVRRLRSSRFLRALRVS